MAKKPSRRKHNRSNLRPPPIELVNQYKQKLNSANGNRTAVLKELREMGDSQRAFIVSCIIKNLGEYLALEEEIDHPSGPTWQTTLPLFTG